MGSSETSPRVAIEPVRYYSVDEAFFAIRRNYENDFARRMSLRGRTI